MDVYPLRTGVLLSVVSLLTFYSILQFNVGSTRRDKVVKEQNTCSVGAFWSFLFRSAFCPLATCHASVIIPSQESSILVPLPARETLPRTQGVGPPVVM